MPKNDATTALLKTERRTFERLKVAIQKTTLSEAKRMYRLIRTLRQAKGLSIAELSKRAGVTEYMIRRIESPVLANPGMSKLYRLGVALTGNGQELFTVFERGQKEGRELKAARASWERARGKLADAAVRFSQRRGGVGGVGRAG